MPDDPKLKIAETNDDPYDLDRLRVSQDFLESTPVKKMLTTIPIRKPGQQEFFRVHPSPAYRDLVAFLELKEDREFYVVDLAAVPDLQGECFIATLFTCMTRSGVLFMWPVRVPASDGRINSWHASAAKAAPIAMQSWIRVKANSSLGGYDVLVADANIPDPEWPELTFREIFRVAIRDLLINAYDHPVYKRLRGR